MQEHLDGGASVDHATLGGRNIPDVLHPCNTGV